MNDSLEITVDKFIFKVAKGCYYSPEGIWAQEDNGFVRVGLSDYVQQRSGDVAFAEIKPTGTILNVGDELAVIETIKVNISLVSPVRGKVIEVNPAMIDTPEAINLQPYDQGWLAVIEATDWATDRAGLLEPQDYLALMKGQAEQEARKL
jgi:glycine cleavage system H protein